MPATAAAAAAAAGDKVDSGAVPAPSSSASTSAPAAGRGALGDPLVLPPNATRGDATDVDLAEKGVASRDSSNLSTRAKVTPEPPLVPSEGPARPPGNNGVAAADADAAEDSGSSLWGVMTPAAEFLKGWVESAVPQKKRELKREAGICWERQW